MISEPVRRSFDQILPFLSRRTKTSHRPFLEMDGRISTDPLDVSCFRSDSLAGEARRLLIGNAHTLATAFALAKNNRPLSETEGLTSRLVPEVSCSTSFEA